MKPGFRHGGVGINSFYSQTNVINTICCTRSEKQRINVANIFRMWKEHCAVNALNCTILTGLITRQP